jgi:tetraacyldisaccharide 4'-kinase
LQRFGLHAGLALRRGRATRNLAYDRGWLKVSRAAVPVVSVGNLTLGGTGKTPCVEYVARFYRERRLRVAILSRGYGIGGHNDGRLVLEEPAGRAAPARSRPRGAGRDGGGGTGE